MAEIKTDENASRALDKDRTDDVSCVSSSRVWHDLGGSSPIQQPQLNRNDLHLCVSSKLLIED